MAAAELHASRGDIQAAIGPVFIGFIISLSLYGVGLAQTIFYYYYFPWDGRIRRSLVAVVNIMDLLQTVAILTMLWELLVPSRLSSVDDDVLAELPWQIYVFFFTTLVVETAVQGFFYHRVWRVTGGNLILLVIIGTCMLASFIAETVIPFTQLVAYAHFQAVPLLVVDGTISGSLMYHFNASRVGMPRTEPVMRQLIWLSVNTGLLLCSVTAVSLYVYTSHPHNASYLAPFFILSKLYLNSLMAALNSRRHFRAVITRTMTNNIHLTEASRIATE